MAKAVSCKRLAELINEFGELGEVAARQLREKCEAFGRDVYCFLRCEDRPASRLEDFLSEKGVKIDRYHFPESSITRVSVTYFQARKGENDGH